MSLALSLKPRVLRTYDSDAAAYISAVESADGESLESGIKDAINEFVIGCKVRGIWDAIKSCCLLCGARTIAGATVPLKGTAPTLTGFVGDYNRETGLKRTSGNFSINRNNNTDPQDNKHVAVYPTSIDYGSSDSNFRSLLAGGSNSGNTFMVVNSLGLGLRANTSLSIVSNQPVNTGNLIGVSILDSSSSQLLYNNRINTLNINTVTPVDMELYLFGGPGLASSTSRIAFYSIGERLDLRLLNDLVTQLRRNILISLSTFQATDSDVLDYIKRVELADGFILENAVKQAIDNLVIGLKEDNLWNSIKACCILSGAKTVAGALTPLVGPSPQNFNFTSAHYNRSLGLTGLNNSPRYLNSRRRSNSDPQDNHHMCVYRTSNSNLNVFIGSAGLGGPMNGDILGSTGQNAGTLWSKSRSDTDVLSLNYNSGSNVLIGIARNNADNYEIIGNNLTTTINAVSSPSSSNNIYIFSGANTSNQAGGINLNTDARLSFYSIGEYLNLSFLDARLDTFMTALSNANI